MDLTPTQPQTPNHIETTSNVRGRVCSRAGCGKLLIGSDGRLIYDCIFAAQNAVEPKNGSGCKRNAGRREAADAHIADESSTAIVRRMAGCRVTTHRLSSKVS